jgi:hypothetical protein
MCSPTGGRVVLRSATEGAIALNALANDASFLDQLIQAHYHNQRKLARIALNDPDYRATYSREEMAAMEQTVLEIDARERAANPPKFHDISKWRKSTAVTSIKRSTGFCRVTAPTPTSMRCTGR